VILSELSWRAPRRNARAMIYSGRFVLSGIVCVCALLAASGCVTETTSSAPITNREKPSRPTRPVGVEPQQMVLSAGMPSDADGNGFPDQIPVTIYLFGDARQYAMPIAQKGTFEFEVKSRGGYEIGKWVFSEEETARAMADSPAGLCYRFALRLSPGKDRIRSVPVSLRAIFTDAKTGQKIVSPGSATVRLGNDD